MVEEEHSLIATTIGAGSAFWVVSKEPLPENFQLSFSCLVPTVRGRDRFVANDRHLYRPLRHRRNRRTLSTREAGLVRPWCSRLPYCQSGTGRRLRLYKHMACHARPLSISHHSAGRRDVAVAVDGKAALLIAPGFPLKRDRIRSPSAAGFLTPSASAK